MKKSILIAAAGLAIGLSSCHEEAKLASQLEGSWSGAPERFTTMDVATSTMTPTYTFELGEGDATGGTVTIAAMVNALMPVNTPSDGVILPFEVTASAIGTLEGTWRVTDDDHVALNINVNTLNVNINPDNITTANDALDDTTLSYWQTNKESFTENLKRNLTTSLQMRFMALRELDDVKIKNNVLEYEYMDTHYFFHRDGMMP